MKVFIQLGRILKERRVELNLSQTQLSDLCGVSYATIGQIERGQTNVSIITLMKIVDALDCRLKIEVSEMA